MIVQAATLVALSFGSLALSVVFGRTGYLRKVMLIHMVLITLFGSSLLILPFGTTNAGTIWYSAVVAAQAVIAMRDGWRKASEGVIITMCLLMFCILGVGLVVEQLPATSVSIQGAYATVFQSSRTFITAAFTAFVAGQAVMIFMGETFRGRSAWWYYGAAAVAMQAVDSAVFFPLAFGFDSSVIRLAVFGWLIKSAIALATVPLVAWLAYRRDVSLADRESH